MSTFYDRKGNKISLQEWSKRCENRNYKIVKQEYIPDGKWISTVWLGLDHSFGRPPPMIFETMVFPKKDEWLEIDVARYTTEAEALAGHKAMVDEWTSKIKKK